MSDRIYSNDESHASNFVVIGQACRGVLTKVNRLDGSQIPFHNVKYYNFFEEEIINLRALYSLSAKMLNKPKCCFLRCRIKDHNIRKAVQRLANGDGATLIPGRFNWFAIDIDGYGVSNGDLLADASICINALPSAFHDSECFVVASGSYGLKEGIHIRLFYWSQEPVSNLDLNKALKGSICDRSIYSNPVQPIYTAAPIFDDGIDPVDVRILWIQRAFNSVNVPSEYVHSRGMPEIPYTKQQAEKFVDKACREIGELSYGDRHDGLIKWGYLLGKMVGQDHFEREDIIDRAITYCSLWSGHRDEKKDLETLTYAIDHGIASIGDNYV